MDSLRTLLSQIKTAADHSSTTAAGEMSDRLCDVTFLAQQAERILAEIEAADFIPVLGTSPAPEAMVQ